MLNRPESSEPRRQQLSLLMDGELSPDDAAQVCAHWRHDAQARADWHAWHLIGDVLRSDELAVRPARDEAFLKALRQRLGHEPVPLAPQPAAAAETPSAVLVAHGGALPTPAAATPRRPRSRLMAPAAMAAGFVAVVGVMVAMRAGAPEGGAPVLAQAKPQGPAASAVLVRNPQLDRYLSAHRALANGAMPGAGSEPRMHIVFEGQ